MGKKRKMQNPKGPVRKQILSNSLVPARSSGEKPDMAFRIKTEEDFDSDMQPTNSIEYNGQNLTRNDILSFVEESKINSNINPESRESSNDSTATEPMETDHLQNLAENQVVPNSFSNILVKQEPELSNNQMEAEGFTDDSINSSLMPQKSTTQETFLDSSAENSLVNRPVINSCVKSNPVDNDEISQSVHESNANFHIKYEPGENNENITESQSSCDQEVTHKRKIDENLKEIRKRMKPEPVDDAEEHEENLPAAHDEAIAQTPQKEGEIDEDDEHLPAAHDEAIAQALPEEIEMDEDEEIAVIPQPKVKVQIITIDSEDDAESEGDVEENENFSKPQNFSTDVLKYFNVVSELDRYDCKKTLELVAKYKTKNNILDEFFPIIKRENRQPFENRLGDILFKSSATETDFDTVRSTASSYVAGNVSNLQFCQPTVQPVSACVNSPSVSTSPSPAFSLQSPPLPATPSANLNPTRNPQPAAFPSTSNSIAGALTMTFEQMQEALRIVQLSGGNNNFTFNANSSVAANVNFHDASASQPSTLPAAPYPSVSANTASSLPTPVSASLQHVRDPRLAQKNSETQDFAPRKGRVNLFLYRKIGQEDVTRHFKAIILQWNPSWILTQLRMHKYPPICDAYPTIKLSYSNEMAYYNTYVPLHLLNIWFSLYNRWMNKQGLNVKCTVQSIVPANNNIIQYTCTTLVEENVRMWPKGDDIAWCKHNDEEAFVHIIDVKKRPTDVENKKKLRITLDSFHDLEVRNGDTLQFSILLNIRTAILEAESLTMLHSTLQELVLMPERHKEAIKVVVLQENKHVKELRDEVLSSGVRSRVILVETDDLMSKSAPDMVSLLITQITFSVVHDVRYQFRKGKKSKVLLLLKDDEMLINMYRRLQSHDPILAVRTKQFELSPQLLSCTLEEKLERKERINDIFDKHNIFISTFSAFGKAERMHLSKCNSWNCIIYDAHKCTEVETSLPMTLKLNKLFLMGNKNQTIQFPDILRNHLYHLTFFDRLLATKL